MKRLLDTNSWIALTVETHPHNTPVREWYDAAPLAGGDLLFCRPTEMSFLRLITQESVMKRCGLVALTNEEAQEFLDNVYRDPAVGYVDEPVGVRKLWLQLAKAPVASPNVWMDAYLSAIAISSGAELVTFDRGFVKFQTDGLVLRLLDAPKQP